MQSITKLKLNRQQLEKLTSAAFRCGIESWAELDGGWFNGIYTLRLTDSREVILKLAPPPEVTTLRYEKNLLHCEVAVYRLLAETGKIPVPEILYFDPGRTLINTEFFFMEKLPGRPYSLAAENLSESVRINIESQIGKYNRCINELTGTRFGLFIQKDKQTDTWMAAFHSMLEDVLQDGMEAGVHLPLPYAEIAALLVERAACFKGIDRPCLLLWDLHPGNVLVEAGQITGIIDCDRALWGDPLMEYYFCGFESRPYFLQGYGNLDTTSQAARVRRSLYDLYMYLIMLIETTYRQFTKPGHEEWAYGLVETGIAALKALPYQSGEANSSSTP